MPKTHALRLQQPYFDAVADGSKTFEIRRDRGRCFAVGDTLQLREYDALTDSCSGRQLVARVSYISDGFAVQLPGDAVVLALADVMWVMA